MRIRSNSDYIISGGLWWNDKGIAHSLNLLIHDSKQIAAGVYSRFGLVIDKDGSYKFDWYKWNNNLKSMLGGSPSLVIEGKINIDKGDMESYIMNSNQPRAGVGMNDTHFFLVTVDGRQQCMKGATVLEFALIMQDLGCLNAIGGDGGGTVRLEDKEGAINSPTENRAMNNSIGIKLKEEYKC